MHVRRLEAGSVAVWRHAVERLVSAGQREHELLSAAECQSALADDRCYLIVAEDDARPAGLLSAYRFPDLVTGGALVYLYDVIVDDAFRQRGIGTAMLNLLIGACRRDDVHTIWAGTDVANTAARRLFAHTGGVRQGETYAEFEWRLGD